MFYERIVKIDELEEWTKRSKHALADMISAIIVSTRLI